MCLAVPFKVTEMNGVNAVGELGGMTRTIRLDFIPDPKVGDYVIVHAGFAIERLDAAQAEEDRAAYMEMEEAFASI